MAGSLPSPTFLGAIIGGTNIENPFSVAYSSTLSINAAQVSYVYMSALTGGVVAIS